jgi:flavodoxin
MNDILKFFQEGYKNYLLEKYILSSFGSGSKRDDKKYFKEKEQQILVITHALASVNVFKQLPDPPKEEIKKVVESIKRAMELDPEFFSKDQLVLSNYINDVRLFLEKYDK